MSDTFDDVQSDEFPAVEAAYAFVVPSYQLLVSRFEAADTRLTTLLTASLTLTGAVAPIAKALRPEIRFADPLFVGAVLFALVCIGFGVFGRINGRIVLPDPMKIYTKSLRRSVSAFKMSQIYYAGENFNTNAAAIDLKGQFATVMTVALALEVASLVLWLAR